MSRTVIPSTIRAVFFDAVGTVLLPDPGPAAVYAEAARRFGLDADPAEILPRFRAAFLREEEADQGAGWVTSEERELARWRTIVHDTLPGAPPDCFAFLYQHFAMPGAWRVPPDAPPLFQHLAARGVLLGLASNFDARLESVLAGRPELAPLAGRIVISSRLGLRKPHPGFFRAMADLVPCEPHEVLLIGDDRVNDYEGAVAAGMSAVLLDPKGEHRDISSRVASLRDLLRA